MSSSTPGSDPKSVDGREDDPLQHDHRAGARAGMVAPDEKTFEYVKGRDYAPQGEAFEKAVEAWKKLPSDEGAVFDETVRLTADEVFPQVTWGPIPEW